VLPEYALLDAVFDFGAVYFTPYVASEEPMRPFIKALVALTVIFFMATTVSAVADATCSISTPAPSLLDGDVLDAISASGQPCHTQIAEGQIANVDFDEAWALEERIMDGEILYLQPAECRWILSAGCQCEASVTVSGPGAPVAHPYTYRALAYQQAQVDIYDNTGTTPQIIDTLSAVPYPKLLYPETGTKTASGTTECTLNYTNYFDGYTKLRMKTLAQSGVRQVPSEWSGQMEAWQIGGDDFIPVVITQQNEFEEDAIWPVR
jgi:hypothetical protein